MKYWQIHNLKIRFSLSAVAILTCALFAPWWGTPIAAAICYLVFQLPTRMICSITFVSWIAACLYRDVSNDFGPSRVFAKMLSTQSIGLSPDTLVSRILVYVLIGAIGFLLALFVGGTLKSVIGLFPERLRSQKALR